MNPKPLRHIDLHSDAGRLEALYRQIDEPRGIAVVSHPHPLHGGTLHNKVIFRASRGFERQDVATLRFNFRGAGASQGRHDNGEGEQQDVQAAIQWMQGRHKDTKLFLAGFSFGAWVSSRVSWARDDVAAMVLIGSPVNMYDMSYIRHAPQPILFLQGSEDEFGEVDKLAKIVEGCRNAELIVVNGADHFFKNQVEIVEETVAEWVGEVLGKK